MSKHRIVGWTDFYVPVKKHTLDSANSFYWVMCECGELITGWNEAVCGGIASAHIKEGKYGQ